MTIEERAQELAGEYLSFRQCVCGVAVGDPPLSCKTCRTQDELADDVVKFVREFAEKAIVIAIANETGGSVTGHNISVAIKAAEET